VTADDSDGAGADRTRGVASASLTIQASRRVVWRTLLAPETIPKILPVTEVVSPWRLGESFVWLFVLADQLSRVEGRVLQVDEHRLLEYDYTDPHSRDVLGVRDNVHRVSIELTDEGAHTRVTVTQDANVSDVARLHAEGGWRLALNHLKWLVEGSLRPEER
jgi:uncharacterized protein YndB with AHSA1/START domain